MKEAFEMSEIKKRIQLLSVFVCCVLLAGCSADETSPVSSAAAKKTELSVSWWGDDVRNEYMLQTLGSFTQQYPDILLSMNYTTSEAYPALCAARNAASMDCDVIQISYEQFCCKDPAKFFYSLSSIKDYLNLHLQSEESLSWGTRGDTLYVLSNSIDLPAFYYNEELLQHLDVSIPSTWEDLSVLADACSRENEKREAADSSPLYPLAMTRTDLFEFLNAWIEQRSGCTMFDEDGMLQYTETQLAELLTFYQTLIRDRLVLLVEEPAFAVSSGQAAGCFSHASYASSLLLACDGAGFTLCSGSLLTADPQTEHLGWYLQPGVLYAISSSASQPREAAKLLRYLISSETVIKNQGLNEGYPSTSGAYQKLYAENRLQGLTLTACMPLLENRDAFSVLPARLASGAVRDHSLSVASEMMERSGDPAEYATRLHAALLLS